MLAIGDPAPNFPLPPAPGGPTSLTDLLARGPVLLYFYPADFTRVCTAQACMLRDAHQDLAQSGLTVIGVSPQGTASHAQFATEHELPFTLIADPDKSITRAYKATWPLGLGIRRVTYLIGRDGRIADRVAAELNLNTHRAFIDRAIAAQNRRASAV
jgi:peroxiredoxin Q/BCP